MFSIRTDRGSAIVIMMMLMTVVTLAMATIYGHLATTSAAGSLQFKQKKNLYIAESARLIATRLVQRYLDSTPQGTLTNDEYSAQISAYLTQQLPDLVPSEFSVTDLVVSVGSQTSSTAITTGPFRGLLAPQTTVQLNFKVSSGSDQTLTVNSIQTTVSLGQIGLHQFMYFLDLQAAGFSPGGSMTIGGRVHSNGDLCFSSTSFNSQLIVTNATAAGRLMHAADDRCGLFRNVSQPSPQNVFISTDGSTTNTHPLLFGSSGATNGNGCVSCEGSGLNWLDFAVSTWGGNALDRVQGVPKLALPLLVSPQTQVGAYGIDDFMGLSNAKTMRFLIDPVLPNEQPAISKFKFAYQADLRIIDGVWYKRSLANSALWPGIPIWSDHPGHFTDRFGQDVGQEDLKGRYSWVSVPRGYSFYGYNEATHTLNTNPGVISYGNLNRLTPGTAPGSWKPGYLMQDNATFDGVYGSKDNICVNNLSTVAPPPALSSTLTTVVPGGLAMMPYDAPLSCSASAPNSATGLLNGTRSGFSDPHLMNWLWERYQYNSFNAALEPINLNRILPVNLDVEQLATALSNMGIGELGDQLRDRRFNGIVWISSTWPGSEKGLDSTMPLEKIPDLWLPQADLANLDSQTWLTSYHQQAPLPFPLCSTPVAGGFQVGAGQPFDQTSPVENRFFIPDCSRYGVVGQHAFPNAIRIYNASSIDPAIFQKGLTLVSNLPVYVQGDVNTSSDVTTATAEPWKPLLVAGDQVTLLSNNWSDLNSPWTLGRPGGAGNTAPMAGIASRPATDTTYNMSIFTGFTWTQHNTTYGGFNQGLHSLPGLMEDWRVNPAQFRFAGSIVVGFYPVYNRGGRYYTNSWATNSLYFGTYLINNRIINYDPHLGYSFNQPPGTPLFSISALQNWKIQ